MKKIVKSIKYFIVKNRVINIYLASHIEILSTKFSIYSPIEYKLFIKNHLFLNIFQSNANNYFI